MPSVQDVLKELRDQVQRLREAREGDALDERCGNLKERSVLESESTFGQIKLLRTEMQEGRAQLIEQINANTTSLSGLIKTTKITRPRQARLGKSAATVNPQVEEFFAIHIKADLHGLATDLAVFDVGLTTSG